MTPARIFLSHSSEDKEFALRIATALRDPTMAPWIDSEQIITGDDIFDRLGHGLQSMDVLVFLISQASMKSEWVLLEVKHAVTRELTEKRALLLPFIIDGTEPTGLPWPSASQLKR
jgi:hypothetical protein